MTPHPRSVAVNRAAKMLPTWLALWCKCNGRDAVAEHRFHAKRKWRLDFAIVDAKVGIELQGGLFIQGRHTQGAALLKEYEKLNAAQALGWRVGLFTPQQNIAAMDWLDSVFQESR